VRRAFSRKSAVNRIQGFLKDWNQSSSLDDFTVSLSIGMTEGTDGKTLDELLDLADRNTYGKRESPRGTMSKRDKFIVWFVHQST
jgi:hypothetical protein